MFWFLCPPSHGGNFRLLALQQSFDSRFNFFLREQTSRVSRKENSLSRHHLSFAVFIAQRKEGVDFIDSHNKNEFKFSYLSQQRDSRRVNHIIMELNFILPFRASCSLFQQQPWMRIGARFWDFTREVFSALHDSVVHLMSSETLAHNGNLIVLNFMCLLLP